MPRRVVAVAHFPPPVHGMAAAVDRLITELARCTAVRRVSISAPGLDRSALYHVVRVARVLRALAVMVAERRRTDEAIFSCDAGVGMLYTLVLTAAARLLGYRMHLQHHSYAYLDRRSPVLAALVRVTGERCVHLVSCPQMRRDFAAVYRGAAVRVVGIASRIVGAGDPAVAPPRPGAPLVLGFLGNTSMEKGLGLALDTARAAARAGVPVELRVAGPVLDAAAADALREAESDPMSGVTTYGPVYGAQRDAFLDGLDVFLFPSRYPHESFGLAAWEAMARGVPLIAYRSGCLTAEAVGAAGTVVDRADDFVETALPVLRRWRQDPYTHDQAAGVARSTALAAAAQAEREVARFCRELAAAPAALAPVEGRSR